MLDPSLLRKELDGVVHALARRGIAFDAERFHTLEARRRAVQVETETVQAQRNALAKQIGQLKARGQDATAVLAQAQAIPSRLQALEAELTGIQTQLADWLMTIPNLPHASVPDGAGEADNVEVRRWIPPGMAVDEAGLPRPLAFEPKDHVTLGEPLGLDFDAARRLSGARFMVLRGSLARLHRALAQFMLDVQTREHGYEECYTPYIVNRATLLGTGQLPKFKDDMFWVHKGGQQEPEADAEPDDLYLISTSEITLAGAYRDAIVPQADLPIKLTAHTPCFRSEAGSGGRDMRGIIRQHQFDKVEMVQLVHPEQSYQALEDMVGHAEAILQKLALPYRVMALCAGDMGFSAAKTYDIEVWLPAQNTWREISSISNCEAFQSRRLQARWRPEKGKPDWLHTLNGSGLAVGRALVAVLENYQQPDGSLKVPDALQPWMGG